MGARTKSTSYKLDLTSPIPDVNHNMKTDAQKVPVTYDPDADVLSMASSLDAKIDYAREMGNFIVHFGKNDEPVLIEVLEASDVLRHEIEPLSRMAATPVKK